MTNDNSKKSAPKAPNKSVGGIAGQGKNSKVDYRPTKTVFKMRNEKQL